MEAMVRGRMLILLLLAGCIALRAHLPRESSWIADSGDKPITVESIALNGFTSVAAGWRVPYAGPSRSSAVIVPTTYDPSTGTVQR